MLAPLGERSISIAVDCFVPDRTALARLLFCLALLGFGRLREDAADLAAVRFFAVFVIGISFGSVATSRLHRRSPAAAHAPAGRDPGAAKRAGSKHSSAPITSKCQSFLDNLVAQIARNRARDDPMSALPPKADMCGATSDVRFGPKADSCTAAHITEALSRGQFRALVC
jgi:hypothetical protein